MQVRIYCISSCNDRMSVLNSQELLLQEDWSDCNVHKMDVALTHLYMNTMIRFIYSILCTKPLQLLFGDPDFENGDFPFPF